MNIFENIIANASIEIENNVTRVSVELDISNKFILHYREFSNAVMTLLEAGRITPALEITLNNRITLKYVFINADLFFLIFDNTELLKNRFTAKDYFIYRMLIDGRMEEDNSKSSRELAPLSTSILSPGEASVGWVSQALGISSITGLVIFSGVDLIKNKSPGASECINSFLGASDENKDDFVIATFDTVPEITRMAKEIITFDYHDDINLMHSEANALRIISLYSKQLINQPSSKASKIRISKEDLSELRKIYAYISHNYSSSIKIADLTKKFKINRRKLTEGFRELFDSTVHGFVTEQRMNAAKTLILEEVAIVKVADIVGYSSEASFNRAFKDYFGIPPAYYRKTHGS